MTNKQKKPEKTVEKRKKKKLRWKTLIGEVRNWRDFSVTEFAIGFIFLLSKISVFVHNKGEWELTDDDVCLSGMKGIIFAEVS